MFSQGEPPRSESHNRISGKMPKRGVARMKRAMPQSVRGRVSRQQPRSSYRPGSRVAMPAVNPPAVWANQSFCASGPT